MADADEAHGIVDGLRDAVVDILDAEVTNTALLTPPRLRSLAEPAGTVRVPIDDASVAGAEAPDYLGLAFDDPLQRVARQEAWWRAWFATVGAASDPADRLPAIVIELVDVVRAVAAGTRLAYSNGCVCWAEILHLFAKIKNAPTPARFRVQNFRTIRG